MPPRKRTADEAVAGPRRSSRRTSTKSQYFDNSDDELNDKEVEDTEPPPKRKRGRPPKKPVAKKEDSEEPYQDEEQKQEEDEDDEDSDDSDAPPKVTFIPLPKLLDPGGIEYEDPKLHPNTLSFLKELKANNRRPWLKLHDPEYRRALKDWESFVICATETVADVDETIPELPVKDVIFRIYRDVRFSKNPTPYKPHFSAAWSRTGRKGSYACYYIHCEPGSAFIGGGIWCPAWDKLLLLRQSVNRRPKGWRRVLNDPDFKRIFLPKLKQDAKEKAVLRAFAAENKEGALSLAPAGYSRDHPDIELLRLKNFTVKKKIKDDLFTSENAQEQFKDILRPLLGFVSFLNSIVMPDPNLDEDADDDDEDDEGEEEEAEDEEEGASSDSISE
ncbi:hypothetical protein AK830_g9931 [Neonectria ditissima]|uniref:Uncharacterized protein n=1 Tax=Neonectria ditissima TaxID=78410 RepID=A0A0P7B8A7_9HYPO|nr:hypothetical protein AK830_g9931 [Neonectria ditissima]